MSFIWSFLAGKTAWSLPLKLYLLFLGWQDRKKREISILSLLQLPTLLIVWQLCTLYKNPFLSLALLCFALALVAGAATGFLLFPNREKPSAEGKIQSQGSNFTLLMILLLFFIQSYFSKNHSKEAAPLISSVLTETSFYSFISGIFLGKACFSLKYWFYRHKSP